MKDIFLCVMALGVEELKKLIKVQFPSRGNMGIKGGWSKQIWLRLYLKLVAVVGFLIQILNNILINLIVGKTPSG